jgi:hypothetical protein
VDADLVGRDPGQRVVERLDVQAGHATELLQAQPGVLDVAAHGQVGAVDLQHEPRPRDRLVLVPHRLRDGGQVRLVAAVVLVAEEERDHPGRGGGEESLRALQPGQRRPQIVRVGGGRRGVAYGDRSRAGRGPTAGAAGVAEHAPRHPRKLREVLVLQRVAGAAEAGETVLHVGGVGGLAHLAVVDDTDAGVDLLARDLGHGGADARGERGRVDRHAFLPGEHRTDQVVGPREAAGVGREEAVGAALHGAYPTASSAPRAARGFAPGFGRRRRNPVP